MSNAQKCGIIQELRQHGFNIVHLCAALDISRSSYYRSIKSTKQEADEKDKQISYMDEQLIEQIKSIISEHPFWGYRRVTAWLKYRERIWVNHKRVYRLMKQENLCVKRKQIIRQSRPKRRKIQASKPKTIYGIDMTKFLVEGYGWLYLIVMMDWFTKRIVGYRVHTRCRTQEWLEVLRDAVLDEFPDGIRNAEVKLISDNGCQPTS